jgi:hypothetical protein
VLTKYAPVIQLGFILLTCGETSFANGYTMACSAPGKASFKAGDKPLLIEALILTHLSYTLFSQVFFIDN